MGVCTGTQKQKVNRVEQMIQENNMNLLLDQWPASFIYLLKQKFQSVAHFQADNRSSSGKKYREGLDYEAFMKLFTRLRQQPKDVQQKAFCSFDLDKSSRIDFKEFCLVLSLILNSDQVQQTAFIFQLYDSDNDQALSKQEFKYFVKANLSYIHEDEQQQKVKESLMVDPLQLTNQKSEPLLLQNNSSLQQDVKKVASPVENQQKPQNIQKKTAGEKNQMINKIVHDMFNQGQQKKQKIKIDEYEAWVSERFDLDKYIENFELVPGPLREREIIRQIMKNSQEDKNLSQQHYYVISYKWWERWRFYINYSFVQKNKHNKIKDIHQQSNQNKFQDEGLRISRKLSNVSLVDLDLGNTIPSEMKEEYSISKKIQNTLLNNQDDQDLQPKMIGPGKLMRSAKENQNINDQIKQQYLGSGRIDQDQPHTGKSHKYSQSIPVHRQAKNELIDQIFDLVQFNDVVIPKQSIDNFSGMKAHGSLNEFKDVPFLDGSTKKNDQDQIQQGDLIQGQQGSSKQAEEDLVIPIELPNLQEQRYSEIADPLRNPPLDYQIQKYGICETEGNEELDNNIQKTIFNNEQGYLQSLRPGQIDNSDLQGEFQGELILNILNNHDYVLVPEEAWNSLVQWYGISDQGIQVYKRKVFSDKNRAINILDMYPPVIKGYTTDNKGCIQYPTKVTLMISARKKMSELFKKFSKRMKLGSQNKYQIFYKRIGEQWSLVSSMDNSLIDYQIDTGTFLVFVNKNHVNVFKEGQYIKDIEPQTILDGVNNDMSNRRSLIVPIRLGDLYDVQHVVTNEWKLCHVCEIQQDGAMFHIKKESYLSEFFLDTFELVKKVEWPGERSRNNMMVQQFQGQTPGMISNFNSNLNYPGLGNLGNTCFMNAILQCIMHTPLFRDYLINQAYQDELVIRKKDSKSQSYLVVELAKLINNLKNFKSMQKSSYGTLNYVQPQDFKKSIDQILPQFSGYEQHDAQEFLSLFLDGMSDELQKPQIQDGAQYNSVIKELFMGKTINELKCSSCLNQSFKQEDFFTLSLPIPIQDEVSFEVTFVRRCSKLVIPPLKKYGIKVSKYGTLKDFIQSFEKVSGYSHIRFDFLEVYRNGIHKPLFNIDQKTTIRHLGLKPYDELFAYEIYKSPKDIEDESNALMALTPQKKQFKIDDYVDIQDHMNEWRYGQIKDIREKITTNDTMYKIKIIFDKTEIVNWYSPQKHLIAPYRTKALQKKNAQILHVINRIYNPQNDGLEKFAIPFIITVPNWLTWKEFRVLIYGQAKRFIDFSYFKKKISVKVKDNKIPQYGNQNFTFNDNEINNYKNLKNESDNKTESKNQRTQAQAQSVHLGQANDQGPYQTKLNSQYVTPKKQDIRTPNGQVIYQREFSDSVPQDELGFLRSPDFPYRLRLINQSTNSCIVCDKPITYNRKKMTNKYCQTCEFGLEDAPINLNQSYNNQPLIALDWIDSLAFNPLSTSADHDASYIQLKQEKKDRKDRITQEECFNLLTAEEKFEIQCDHCKSLQPATAKFFLSKMPNILILHLKRFQFRDGFLEKIENDIDFPIKSFNLSKWAYNTHKEKDKIYDLYAVANHMGNGQEGHYTTYVCVQNDGQDVWLNFDDDQVREVNQLKIMSQYTYLLFYKRREFSSSAIINLTFRSFGQIKK